MLYKEAPHIISICMFHIMKGVDMTKSRFFRPMFDALDDGKVIRSSIALAMKILAVLSIVGGVYLLVDVLKGSFDMPTEGTIGGIILALFLAASIAIVAQMLFHRANNIHDLDNGPFMVIPICSILIRMFGEIYLAFGMATAVGGCIFIWLAKSDPIYLYGEVARYLPTMIPQMTFLGGIFFMGYFALMSLIVFIVSYFLAEAILVMADAARNLRHLYKGS